MFLGDEDNNKWSSDETRALSRGKLLFKYTNLNIISVIVFIY